MHVANNSRKGIILAGGNGTRLNPLTKAVSKQLLPIYDKPMIYYPLSTLMLSGIKDILIITKKNQLNSFKKLLGDGRQLGIRLNYSIQESPNGIAEAFLIAEDFIKNSDVTLILGDNLFHGNDLIENLRIANQQKVGATIFAFPVKDPERYGIVNINNNNEVTSIIEKPNFPESNLAITGLYFYDNSVIEKAKKLKPSKRGELEISDINKMYLNENLLNVKKMGRGMAWFDAGTFESLIDASYYIRTLQNRQGLLIGCPEEIAWRNRWISDEKLNDFSTFENYSNNEYLHSLTKNN